MNACRPEFGGSPKLSMTIELFFENGEYLEGREIKLKKCGLYTKVFGIGVKSKMWYFAVVLSELTSLTLSSSILGRGLSPLANECASQ